MTIDSIMPMGAVDFRHGGDHEVLLAVDLDGLRQRGLRQERGHVQQRTLVQWRHELAPQPREDAPFLLRDAPGGGLRIAFGGILPPPQNSKPFGPVGVSNPLPAQLVKLQ
jgi:hypothetical protein